tara:strand:+ start:702 stop:1475 length:774 start_codon:yes stop_codon:yes gene_type:complete
MTFLDKKEETFDLVLTEKGREKLSKGKFKPHSYSFYDNEVVYDRSYSSTAELQNEIATRIKRVPIYGEQVTWDDTQEDVSGVKDPLKYPKYYELGGFDFTGQNKPAWRVYAKEGYITGSVKHIPLELEKTSKITSLDSYTHDKIPQLNVYCEYRVYRTVDPDGTEKIYVDRSSDDMKFEIYEENSFDDKENFILEVHQYSQNYDELKKLIFVEEKDPITQDNVEHFFNIATDKQKTLDINYTEFMKNKLVFEDECQK